MIPFKDYPVTGPALDITQPMIRLFSNQEITTEQTDGKIKAKQIEESFTNPFQKFLPAKKFNEISTAEDKAKSGEVPTQETESGAKVSDDDVVEVAHRYTKASERYTKLAVEKNDNTPDQLKKRKRENVDESRGENESQRTLRGRKQKKKGKKSKKATSDKETAKTSEFVPYDYNNASLEFAQARNEETANVFNPYKKLREKGKEHNSKVHMKSGIRSMTFKKT